MPNGTASQIAMPNRNSLPATFISSSLWQNTYAIKNAHAAGTINRNTANPVIVSRYFSSMTAHSTIRNLELRSISFWETASPVSLGKAEIATEAAVDAAVSFMTVSCFSSRY